MSLQSVRDWMGDRPPAPATIPLAATFAEVVSAITEGRKGAAAVLNDDGTLAGIITDGDVRRAFSRDLTGLTAADIMSPDPRIIAPDARMSDAVDLMTQNRIATLLVVEANRPVAIVHIAELMQAGYVG
jgi:arabinose-5-phosphate isomerase